MSDGLFTGVPGEPVADEPSTLPTVANADQPTGTPMDTAVDVPIDRSDPMAAALADWFEGQPNRFPDAPSSQVPPAAPASDDGSPAQPPAESETPVSPQGVEGAVEGQQPDGEPLAADPSADPAAPPPEVAPQAPPTPPTSETPPVPGEPPASSWVPEGHVLVGDRPIPQAELGNLLNVYDWAKSMPPEMAQAIADLQSGQYVLTPRHSAQPTPSSPASGSGAPSPTPPFSSGGEGAGQPDYLDPALAARVEQIAQQQEQLLAFQRQQAEQAVQAQQAQFQQQVESGRQAFVQTFSLSEPEAHYLMDQVAKMQMLPALVRQNNGDIATATQAAMEAAYWATPDFRNRHVGQETQQQVDQTLLQNQALQEKRQRAASLAGTGTPVPRSAPASSAPLTRESATNGIVSEIAAHLAGSSNNGNN